MLHCRELILPLILSVLLGAFCTADLSAQATVLGTQTADGTYATYNYNDLGVFRQFRMQASTGALSGVRNWEFCQGTTGTPDYSTNWRPYFGGSTLAVYNQTIQPVGGLTACAVYNTGFGGSSGLLPAITANNYYTFNITEYSTAGTPANEHMAVLETNYLPVSILSVAQTPSGTVYSDNQVVITVTTSATPSAGEYLYVRYANTYNFPTSTLVEVSMTGTTGTAFIPCLSPGDSVYYYVYSSNRTSASILTDVATPGIGETAHDMSALNLDNNGGPNYKYEVVASGGNFCGPYYVPSSCYPTVASFVTALNAGTVTCAVTCYVAAGHTETAPAGGINLTQTGTAANTITFQKYGAGINPVINAFAGSVILAVGSVNADGIFSLNGSDYITVDGIDLMDNNIAAPGTMEYGYGLFKTSATNGCQNNTIQNCSITLKATNSNPGPPQFEDGSKGIFAGNITRTAYTSALTVASAGGQNNNNTFISNTIKDANIGIVLRGYYDITSPYDDYDQNNIIGQAGAGNVIEHFGGTSTSPTFGIYVIYQNNINISSNSIDNDASSGMVSAGKIYGIFNGSNNTTNLTTTAISDNTISLVQGANAYDLIGIQTGSFSGQTATNVTISNNTIQNCTFTAGHGFPGVFYGIFNLFNATNLTISNNTISNNTINSTTTWNSYLIRNHTNSLTTFITDNVMINNSKTDGLSSGHLYGYFNDLGTVASSSETIEGNTIEGLSVPAGSTISAIGIQITTSASQIKYINGNSISGLTGGGTGTSIITAGIIADGMPAGSTVNDNTVSDITSGIYAIGINCGAPTNSPTSASTNVSFSAAGNTISNITNTATLGSYGMNVNTSGSVGSDVTISDNIIDGVTVSGAGVPTMTGIRMGGGSSLGLYTVSDNTISNVSHTSITGSTSAIGIQSSTTNTPVNIYQNHIYNISGNSSGDQVMGILVSTGTTTFNIYNNYIQRLTLPASAGGMVIYGISCTAPSSTYNVYYNTIALGQDAVISGPGTTGIYYQTSGTLNLRNNIIYVRATPTANGVASCVRRGYLFSAAGSAPSNFGSSNNNFYYVNTGANNYIYVEGVIAGPSLINGYAYAGATTSVSQNLNNDPCFNVETTGDMSSYKYFMSPRESNSFYDVPPFAGGATLPDNLKLTAASTSYAESKAVDVASIGTDWEGDIRQGYGGYTGGGTAPDIGADEGEFVVLDPSCYLLPIELLEFNGWYNGMNNELHWTTATELNSNRFDIEKSFDGKYFYKIGEADAAGNSHSELSYVFFDDDPFDGMNYYRLKLIDNDETFSFSNVILIYGNENNTENISVFPNPAHNKINIYFSNDAGENAVLSIVDVVGKKMTRDIMLKKDGYTATIDISSFAPGTYFIKIRNTHSGELKNLKFLKQ
ncbi:MAG: T9SS type A sorting domain-containing protein [Chitinophagales bacterium]|nr:T9SS type A sorting domain-containing protein [Chitinophagales bacterium]